MTEVAIEEGVETIHPKRDADLHSAVLTNADTTEARFISDTYPYQPVDEESQRSGALVERQ